jgi:hypothetical protein
MPCESEGVHWIRRILTAFICQEGSSLWAKSPKEKAGHKILT